VNTVTVDKNHPETLLTEPNGASPTGEREAEKSAEFLAYLRNETGFSGSDEELLQQIRAGQGPVYVKWREQLEALVAQMQRASVASNPTGEDLSAEIAAARAEARAERRKRRAGSH
jgi:hypothetical protein